MDIIWITSEARPYAMTGGLADVSGALPRAFAERGHRVSVIMPYYKQQMGKYAKKLTKCYDLLGVRWGDHEEWASIWELQISKNLCYYFIEFDRYFDRAGLYDWQGNGYDDNSERYIFFSKAAMQAVLALKLEPDILHTNDWHTALCNVYLKSSLYREQPNFAACRSILTIHNIGYQGVCHKDNMPLTGLSWKFFNYFCLEYYDQLNLLKGGIMTADMVNTVSPTNAVEILSPEFGFTLDPSLQHCAAFGRLRGILNGIDYQEWNPQKDKYLPAKYSAKKLDGKAVCKKALQQEFGLPEDPGVPVVGLVTRLAQQKGIDVFIEAIDELLDVDLQIAMIGSGDVEMERALTAIAEANPEKFGIYIGYNNQMAHLVEAGSDMFLMPSRYEPCGLNQMYSMHYGAVPIVRAVGGLDDTVKNYEPFKESVATGFKFWELTPTSIAGTVKWAVDVYTNNPAAFKQIRKNGMAQDFSWKHTAELYEHFYEDAHRRF
jgi:starch synthase